MLVGLSGGGHGGIRSAPPARTFPLRVYDSPIFRLCKFLDIRYSRIPNARQPNSRAPKFSGIRRSKSEKFQPTKKLGCQALDTCRILDTPPRSCHTAPMSTQEIAIPAVPGLPDARTATKYYTDLARTAGSPAGLGEGERAESVAERDARRLDERLPGYRPTPASELSFDPRIAYEIALGVDSPTAVFAKYGIAESHAVKLATNEAFGATLRKYKEEISASGISFKLKAKIQAEDLLTHSYLMATDPEVPPAVRADLIKWTARVAGLEPKEKDGAGSGAGGFTLNISFAGEPAAATVGGRVIEGTVVGEE